MSQMQKGQFVRNDHGSIQHGLAVEYLCYGFQFHIVATRAGVLVEGKLPFMPGTAAMAVVQIMRRAMRQHHALNTPIGVKQEPISEEELIAEETAMTEAAIAHAASKPDAAPNNGAHEQRTGPRLVVLPNGGTERV